MTALSVFGEKCFIEKDKTIRFQEDTCFFGNVHVKLDFLDSTSNFFEGYFSNITILQILSTIMGYDPINVYG